MHAPIATILLSKSLSLFILMFEHVNILTLTIEPNIIPITLHPDVGKR